MTKIGGREYHWVVNQAGNSEFVPVEPKMPVVIYGQGPMFISDDMPGFISHADGKYYDSKSKYYRSLKDHGCEIVEKGYRTKPPKKTDAEEARDIDEDVQKAYRAVKYRNDPGALTDDDREICKRTDERLRNRVTGSVNTRIRGRKRKA